MKQHFSEADLLETYYTRPGESMPVMMHLADCADCAARYERLERKMRGLRECPHDRERPESFWVRQRMQILRKVGARGERRASIARITRVAAAAMLVLVLGALVTWRQIEDKPAVAVVETVQASSPEVSTSTDPWQSDELNEYSSMVAWESWVEDGDES